MNEPQCQEILLTGKEKSSSWRDNSLSVGRGLWNEKGETGGKSRVKPSNISVKYTK